jgi:hypothetical protein
MLRIEVRDNGAGGADPDGWAGGDPRHVELAHGAVRAGAQQLVGQFGEPALDEVQPPRAGRREMQDEAGVRRQPALDRRRLVRRGVLEHEVHGVVAWSAIFTTARSSAW